MAKSEQLLVAIKSVTLPRAADSGGQDLNERTRFSLVYERHVGGASDRVSHLIGTLGSSMSGAG